MKTQEERNRYAREWRTKNLERQRQYAREYARKAKGITNPRVYPIYSLSPNPATEIKPYKNESMKRVEKYQSRDLTLFDSRAECELHELKCDFRDYLQGISLFMRSPAGAVELLVANAGEVKARLAGIKAAEMRVEKWKAARMKRELPENPEGE